MKCKTCGKMNCMAHGGSVDTDDESDQGMYVRSAHALKGAAKHSPGHKEEMDEMSGMAKKTAMKRSEHSHKLPKPKLKGLAKGGEVKGVHEKAGNHHMKGGMSKAGALTRVSKELGDHPAAPEAMDDAKAMHKKVLHDSREMPNPKLKGLADGGEVEMDGDDMDMDLELNEMVAGELIDALEKKDKKGILEAIRALVMSSGGKE